MQIKSLNIGQPTTIEWNGKKVETGIFKYPVEEGIFLGKTDVVNDHVMDRIHHGGNDKACYLFSADHYDAWKKMYPELNWQYGMFGENITISGLDERDYYIGDVLRIGAVTVQVSQPRQPCFKLGIRFNTQTVIQKFIEMNQPGIYIRVLDAGTVFVEDAVDLIERQHNSLSLLEVWKLLYGPNPNPELLHVALNNPWLGEGAKRTLRLRTGKNA